MPPPPPSLSAGSPGPPGPSLAVAPRPPTPSPSPPPLDDAEPEPDGEEEDGSRSPPPELRYGPFSHVIMNLPADAPEFLDVFVGAFDRGQWGEAPLPRCHCYCFSSAGPADDPAADAIARAEGVLGCALPGATAHLVRDVSPSKVMLCVEFELPDAVAWRSRTDFVDVDGSSEV